MCECVCVAIGNINQQCDIIILIPRYYTMLRECVHLSCTGRGSGRRHSAWCTSIASFSQPNCLEIIAIFIHQAVVKFYKYVCVCVCVNKSPGAVLHTALQLDENDKFRRYCRAKLSSALHFLIPIFLQLLPPMLPIALPRPNFLPAFASTNARTHTHTQISMIPANVCRANVVRGRVWNC